MKTVYLFSKEEEKQLLKEFCCINNRSYHMVCKIMYENLLGEESMKDSMRTFKYFISGKLHINYDYIKFE